MELEIREQKIRMVAEKLLLPEWELLGGFNSVFILAALKNSAAVSGRRNAKSECNFKVYI